MKRRGEIVKVGDLFQKYQQILKPPQKTVINEVVEVVEDLTGIKVKPELVQYQVHSQTIGFNLPSALKSELRLHESDLKIHLQARLGLKNAPKLFL